MSLRLKLFLLLGGLVALLVAVQWWWTRTLTAELSEELESVVVKVGHSMVGFFDSRDSPEVESPENCSDKPCEEKVRRVEILRVGDQDLSTHVPHHVTEEEGDGEDAGGAKWIHQRIVRSSSQDDGETHEPGHQLSYVFKTEDHDLHAESHEVEDFVFVKPGAGSDAEPVKEHVKIHIQHKGDTPFLWLAGSRQGRRIPIPQAGFQAALERFSQRSVLGSLGLLALGLVLVGVTSHRVTGPLRRLAEAARRVGEGALGVRVPAKAGGEVGETIRAFDHMSTRLAKLDARNRELTAQEHLGEIGEIARGLAHTLRNPLNALGLSVEELASQAEGEPAATELAASARRQIRRIDHSIRSFLALASQNGGAVDEADLGELVQDVALEALQDSRGKVRLDVEGGEGLPALRVVEPELRAVVQALVVNAVEASPVGGRIRIRARSAGEARIRLEIDDDGPGLPARIRERLFTPHLSTKPNGSGMGLFLAHRIATTRYGGRLELLDREGGGTRAVLELGARQSAVEEHGHDGGHHA